MHRGHPPTGVRVRTDIRARTFPWDQVQAIHDPGRWAWSDAPTLTATTGEHVTTHIRRDRYGALEAYVAAHRAGPAEGSQVATAPGTVSVTFDEGVGISAGSIKVMDGHGRGVTTGQAFHPAGDPRTVAVRLTPGLTRGAYLVIWHVVSDDSHPVSGSGVSRLASATIWPSVRPVTCVVVRPTAPTVTTVRVGTPPRTVVTSARPVPSGVWLKPLTRGNALLRGTCSR